MNQTETERNQELLNITLKLKQTFLNPRQIENSVLEKLFNDKKYPEMISLMKRHMGISYKLSVKCITSKMPVDEKGHMHEPAKVNLPDFSFYCGKEFQQNVKIVMTFYKEIADNYYRFVLLIAHELSHIVLYSINHPLKKSEEATDITAMILGFNKHYELGHTTFKETFFESGFMKIGYLSFEEVIYVLNIIENP